MVTSPPITPELVRFPSYRERLEWMRANDVGHMDLRSDCTPAEREACEAEYRNSSPVARSTYNALLSAHTAQAARIKALEEALRQIACEVGQGTPAWNTATDVLTPTQETRDV